MNIKELREKSPEELQHVLREQREELRALRFKVAANEHTKVHEIQKTRKVIARILTLLNAGTNTPPRASRQSETQSAPHASHATT